MAEVSVGAIAVFPWVHCSDPIEVGSVRILPYVRGELPGDLPHAKQSDIDAILGAYADRPNNIVTQASLLEVDDWHTGMDDARHAFRLFQAREAIAFSALAKRRLFRGHFNYCNFPTYSLVVQRYESGKGDRFAFYSRRRDTGTNHIWATDRFAFHRPSQVEAWPKMDLDLSLLAAVLRLREVCPLREAIGEFNAANTDSDDIPDYVEMVMVKSAFESLLEIDQKADSLVNALDSLLSPVLAPPPPFEASAMGERWRKRWERAQRPLEAWARDFCVVRNIGAHGSRDGPTPYVWPERTHLAFASIFLPLLVKKRLAADSLLTLDETDHEHLQHIEQLLLVDPYSPESLRLMDENAHPWAEIHYEMLFDMFARRLHRGHEHDQENVESGE
jgi:hypothetical protein